jgi:hypothetical protein
MFLPNDIYSNKHKRSDGIRLQLDGEGVVKLLNDDGMIMDDDEKPTSVAGLYRLYQRESSYQTMLYQHHQRHHPNKQIMHHPSNDLLSAASTMMLSSDSTSTTIPDENLSPRGEVTAVYSNETLPATVSSDEEDDNEVANDEKLAEFAIAMARRMREKHCPTITRRGSVYLDDVIYSSPPSSSTIASVELFGDFIIGMADEASSVSSSSSSSSSSTVTSKQRSIFSLEEKSAAALFKVDALQRNGIRAIDTTMPTVVDLDLSSADTYNNDNDSLTVSPTYSTTEGSRNHISPFRGPRQQQNKTCPPSIDNSYKKTEGDDIVPQLTIEECTSFESSSTTISPSSLIKSPARVNLVTTLPSVRADVKTQFWFDAAGMSSTGLHPSTKKGRRVIVIVVVALCIGIFGLHHIDSIVTQQPTTFGIVPAAVIEPFHSVIDILIMASNLANDYEEAASSMSLVAMNENDSRSTTIGMTTSLFCGGDSRPGNMSVELWNMINI